jgi:putative DNA primase/helicase
VVIGEAAQIAMALKARRSGDGWIGCCPCPHHGNGYGDRNASLKIAEGAGGILFLKCFAGCIFDDVITELQRRGILSSDGLRLTRARRTLAYANPAAADHEPDQDALVIWNASDLVAGTVAQNYLERRGIMLTPPSLRCGYRGGARTMVAAVQRPDGRPVAVQSTLLTGRGMKAPVAVLKVTTGALGGGAVRFAAAANIMGIAEGCETALSAMAMAELPVWASLGCHRLHRVVLPELVREVHIFGDNDEPGRAAAQRAAAVHLQAGRRVVIRFPPDGVNDFNDLLLEHADRDGSVAA